MDEKPTYDAETCRKALNWMADQPNPPDVEQGIKGVLIRCLHERYATDGDEEKAKAKRYTVLGWLFGDPTKRIKPMSTKELTRGQWYALEKWIKPSRTVTAKWLPCEEFKTESLFVLSVAIQKMYSDEREMMVQIGETENG
jgi:hypothetical protein